jgi:hypothetical protein
MKRKSYMILARLQLLEIAMALAALASLTLGQL